MLDNMRSYYQTGPQAITSLSFFVSSLSKPFSKRYPKRA